jgi:hypothetical protein
VVTRLATLSGVVADAETGRPVPAFHVHARVEGETTGRDARDLIPREFVEPSGSFFIEGLFPGRATVAVQARGYVPWVEDVLLEPGLDAGLRPRLGRGKTLRGQVVNRETDLPVAFVWVVCHPRGNARQVMTVPNSMEWTDEGGTFAISGLAPGKYWVDAYHPEYARRAAAGPQGETKVTIAEEGEPEPLRIAIVPAGGLKGRILNLEGSRSFDTRLELKTAGGEGSVAHWGRVEHDGTFRLTSVPPGTYEVRLKQTFFKVEPEAGQAFLPEDTVEKFTPLGEVEVQAGATAAFEARMP